MITLRNPWFTLNRGLWLLFSLTMLISFVAFSRAIAPLTSTNVDDLALRKALATNQQATHWMDNARTEGRFYFATPVFQYLAVFPYRLDRTSFALLRAALLFAQAGLGGTLIGRLLHNSVLGAAIALAIVAGLHVPPTFFPVLSYPVMGFGFVALLLALHAHLSYLRDGRLVYAITAPVLFGISCLCQEMFVVFTPLFLLLGHQSERGGWTKVIRMSLPVLGVAVAYVGIYAAFAWAFPSQYDGTRISLDVHRAVAVLLRQSVGVFPSFELVMNRESTGSLLRSAAAISVLAGRTPVAEYALGALQSITAAWMIFHASLRCDIQHRYWILPLILAFLVNVPIAFSERYQVFIYHHQFPYVYAFYSFCLLMTATVVLFAMVARQGRLARSLIFSAVAVACVSAKVSNHHVFAVFEQRSAAESRPAGRSAPVVENPNGRLSAPAVNQVRAGD